MMARLIQRSQVCLAGRLNAERLPWQDGQERGGGRQNQKTLWTLCGKHTGGQDVPLAPLGRMNGAVYIQGTLAFVDGSSHLVEKCSVHACQQEFYKISCLKCDMRVQHI